MFKKVLVTIVSMAALIAFSAVQAEVARSIITSGVEDREPVSDLEQVPASHEQIFFFTELRDMTDRSVTHIWKYNNEVMAEVPFNVGGPRWRVWSSKQMLPGWTGEWQVEVVDDTGAVIVQKTFTYGAAETDSDAAIEETPSEEAPQEAEPGGDAESTEEMMGDDAPEQEGDAMEMNE